MIYINTRKAKCQVKLKCPFIDFCIVTLLQQLSINRHLTHQCVFHVSGIESHN